MTRHAAAIRPSGHGLAQAARLDGRRHLGPHLAGALGRPGPDRADRLATLFDRRLVCSGKKGGEATGRSRGGLTSRRHAVCDGNGIPLALHLSDGCCHDITQAVATLEQIRVPRRRGAPRTRPSGLAADKGYDSLAFRRYLTKRGIRHSIPRRNDPRRRLRGRPPAYHPELSHQRWLVERLFAFLNSFRRIVLRHETFAATYLGFLQVAAIVITMRYF